MSDKKKKIFKIVIIALVSLLVIELCYFGYKLYKDRKESIFYSEYNSLIMENENDYIAAGFSDYRHSKFNDYDKGYNKATISVVENSKLKDEISLKIGYNSYFNDIIKTKDGYVAVGSVQMTKDQVKDNLSEGLIVKFDKNFKIAWRKNLGILGKTELLKVKLNKNKIVVIGSSVYGDGYMGNHTTGGGILLEYSLKGKQLLKVNNGGPFHGRFNDFLIEKDGYVVVGLGKANSGVIIKYGFDGKRKWAGSYGYTDKTGITSIEKYQGKYLTTTTKIIDPKNVKTYNSALVIFDKKGKKQEDVKFSSNDINYFNDLEITKNGSVIVCGYTGKLKENDIKSDALIVKFDKDLYEESTKVIKGNNNEYFTKVYLKDNNIFALGYSNSKLKEFDLNGYDYFPIIKKYNLDLK